MDHDMDVCMVQDQDPPLKPKQTRNAMERQSIREQALLGAYSSQDATHTIREKAEAWESSISRLTLDRKSNSDELGHFTIPHANDAMAMDTGTSLPMLPFLWSTYGPARYAFPFRTLPSLPQHPSPLGAGSTYRSPFSDLSSPASYMTAYTPGISSVKSTYFVRSTYCTPGFVSSPASRHIHTIDEEPTNASVAPGPLERLHLDYMDGLQQRHLVLPADVELNWSGKGQHAVFGTSEDIPLHTLCLLGSSHSAIVDKVMCRRIALARKLMRCSRIWSVRDALTEVEHLHRLRHRHIVQLVGTYLQGRNFAILMYPAADHHLGTFLEDTADMYPAESRSSSPMLTPELSDRRTFLAKSLGCLASAVAFIHNRTTKHMDIKPANIVVRLVENPGDEDQLAISSPWQIYLTDFGLSRAFSGDQSQTDGYTGRTPKYCAPEVYELESRGRAADIFSLGCVFIEMLTVYYSFHPHELFASFQNNEYMDESFRMNLDATRIWMEQKLGLVPAWLERMVRRMIHEDPQFRPTADQLFTEQYSQGPESALFLQRHDCCDRKPEKYVAYRAKDPGKS